ncbi:MAG TPA: serine/threonine-protein kinase [Gemmatimonadales bacterium]|nr:serine/threonine-protein kinase [Gemmatimonadales bacterium]
MTDQLPGFTGPLAERYRIERELGQGGGATVYLARDLRHDRLVAVKILRPDLAQSVGAERFLQEIRIAASLAHPNILPLHDSGEVNGSLCYVMPYVEGESLRTRLEREGALPLEEALRIAREVGDALAHAHGQGIIHRDIKPENILLSAGHAVVADFGIARAIAAAGDHQLTATGMAIGTPAYMSPEQAVGGAIDGRTDLYALGCVLYEMLAGEPPHTGPTAQAVLAKRLSEPPPSVRVTRDLVPEALDRAIGTAMARNPADRFATVTEFLRVLAPVTWETQAVRPVGHAPARPGRLVLAAAGTLAAILVGLMLWNRPAPALTVARLAVLPFSVRGDPGFDFLSEGIVDLLARSLDGAGDLRTVDPGTVISALGRDGGTGDAQRSRAVARRLGAGIYLVGSVHAVGGRLRIQAGLYDATSDESSVALSQYEVEGDDANVLPLVDELAARLLVARGAAPGRLFETAALTTSSLTALKAYLTAEQVLRSGPQRIDSAIAGFQLAVAEDSTFALAYYRLAVAAGWQLRHQTAATATAAAVRHSARLAERDRRLLLAYEQYRNGDVEQAEHGFRNLIRDYPDDLEATFQLADLLAYYNPLRGRAVTEARELFHRVLSFDPGFL